MIILISIAAAAAPVRLRAVEPPPDSKVTLGRIMSDPDWIGRAPERPYWSDDGKSLYYFQKREGSELRDLVQVDLESGDEGVVADEELGEADAPGGDWDTERTRKVYVLHGDLFLRKIASGNVVQLTRTEANESAPRFLIGETAVMFRRGEAWFVRDLASGLEYQPADLRMADDPGDEEKPKDYLAGQQQRLFDIIRKREQRREETRERENRRRDADLSRAPRPWYLGEKIEIVSSQLSPDARWIILRVADKKAKPDKRDTMPDYVTDSGYVSTETVRPKVGTPAPAAERLWLLDLESHEKHELDLSVLPAIGFDRLRAIRDEGRAADEESEDSVEGSSEDNSTAAGSGDDSAATTDSPTTTADDSDSSAAKPKLRAVRFGNPVWSEDGRRVAIQAFSLDHKDRWIASIDFEKRRLVPHEHMVDEAWINRRFARLGWLDNNETLFFVSEESGYAQLYFRSMADGSRRWIAGGGEYEVSNPTLSHDGRWIYFTANLQHPGIFEVHRVDVESGARQQITRLGGRNSFVLSPDDRRLLITHSTKTGPPEVYVQDATNGAMPRRMTHTISDRFAGIDWISPEVVAVPSRRGRPIYSRVYMPPVFDTGGGTADDHFERRDGSGGASRTLTAGQASRRPAAAGSGTQTSTGKASGTQIDSGEARAARPAVVFIHGAGYLQNAHHGWSGYFREFMFHTLLARQGYVVLDMDYRASAGYGRDWRTAIYRQMGTPELEDIEDGIRWMVENRDVDPNRVGVYGGSYGGFLTLMALFQKPDLFACGAALRPVTDWAHYNDPYTSNILNTPEDDPMAFERSSPIEFAAGLERPLLICHGMQDNNVLFQDTVRLAQRLIELEKENWEVAIYPIERHGFREPASWLDEYRRILKLFEEHLKNGVRNRF